MYVARDGDRWDIIAHKFLNNAKKAGLILEQNPHLHVLEFTGGEQVRIPENIQDEPKEVETPPWL